MGEAKGEKAGSTAGVDGERVYRRIRWRLIPFLFICYIVSYLDRINVGFAALQMNEDLGLDPRVFGLGAGIFFAGYVIFEVPSNLVLARVGARLWIARIMIVWGLVSCAMLWVAGPRSFFALRFLLGVAEAGFFPGIILYLTYWFPAGGRAHTVALFMTATALAGVVGGPVSGALLELEGWRGLAGWQWMFLLEGLPAIVLGMVVLLYLPNGPQDAAWLSPAERAWLSDRLRDDHQEAGRPHTLRAALASGRVWRLALLYFTLVIGLYGISFWLPQILRGLSTWSLFAVGAASAIPYCVAAAGMVLVGRHSDRTHERRWHVAGPALIGVVGFLLAARAGNPLLSLAALSLAAFGIWSALGPFWAMPTSFLTGAAAAGGIAFINSLGNVGGFFGPYLLGIIKNASGSFEAGLDTLAAMLAASAVLALSFRDERRRS